MWSDGPFMKSSPDHVLDDDEDDGSAERAVEVRLDVARLQAPQGAAAGPRQPREPVDGTVTDQLVEGVVEIGPRAAEPPHEVDEAVDDVLVEPVLDRGEHQRAAHDGRLIELVDVILVV